MPLAICSIFRNEALYLREWIEFHRLVGVERFHLYQNRSDDDWQPILKPYIAEGLVDLIDWPFQPPCQMQAYQHFIDKHAGETGWAAFLDCDEFLFSPCCSNVVEALDAAAAKECGAVGVNWMCFGGSGHERPDGGLVTERFTLRPADSFAPNRHIKSIVRMDRVIAAGPDPHHFAVRGGTFNECDVEVAGPLSVIPSHSRIRINHYHTKSRQEFLRRIALGKPDGAAPRSPSEFDGYQAAEIDDRAIWRFLPALKQQIGSQAQISAEPVATSRPEYAACLPSGTSAPRDAARDFAGFRNCHDGETVLVCGCGSSLTNVVSPERFVTIGVNDVGRLFDPDYLVVINPRSQFSGDRFKYVETSRAGAIFTQLELGLQHANVIRFQLGRRGGADVSDGRSLPYTRNSPYVAMCLALHMGAKRIGLIGVDFTEHHFFAQTGRHSLAGEINQINNEYAVLAEACRKRGVEVFNLSVDSRLTAFPKVSPEQFARSSLVPAAAASAVSGSKVLFVNYKFLSCGEVFTDGLKDAAEDLGMEAEAAYWDDAALPAKVDAFSPDLLFVVHGRNYSQRWKDTLHKQRKSALWLLDEPYEVDDTARFSPNFDTTFVNDPSTISRHRNAHFLPVCYDPAQYSYLPGSREHRVGFIGGGNPAREQMLGELARRGLLSYAVGGPWRTPEVRHLTTSLNIPAADTVKLYRQTQIVVNVFRTAHHFNRERIPAVSMNPRIYEALACGALVVSERRPEIEQLCPEMPVFDTSEQMVSLVENLLADPARFAAVRRACIRRFAGHTYAHRLYTAFTRATGNAEAPAWIASSWITRASVPASDNASTPSPIVQPAPERVAPAVPGWEVDAATVEASGEELALRACRRAAPGSESGLIGSESRGGVKLSFDVRLDPSATFVAKIQQAEQRNQSSNSYHLMIDGRNAYVARHGHIFNSFTVAENAWHSVSMQYRGGKLRVEMDGAVVCRVHDTMLSAGYCFVGIKSGAARIRRLAATAPDESWTEPVSEEVDPRRQPARGPVFNLLFDSRGETEPAHQVSIVTTVYDRVSCLEACLRSVQALSFESFEHIVVADAPNAAVLAQLQALVEANGNVRHRLRFASLHARANDWGIGPATAGLTMASGKYVCFLSDDNGYTPGHFQKPVTALERDPGLGFVYSGCLYDGRLTLNTAPPAYGRIDLGQPLFRRTLFEQHLGGVIPFRDLAWDWKMIQHFIQKGVRWKHIPDATFIFRLAKYPHLMAAGQERELTGSAT